MVGQAVANADTEENNARIQAEALERAKSAVPETHSFPATEHTPDKSFCHGTVTAKGNGASAKQGVVGASKTSSGVQCGR